MLMGGGGGGGGGGQIPMGVHNSVIGLTPFSKPFLHFVSEL